MNQTTDYRLQRASHTSVRCYKYELRRPRALFMFPVHVHVRSFTLHKYKITFRNFSDRKKPNNIPLHIYVICTAHKQLGPNVRRCLFNVLMHFGRVALPNWLNHGKHMRGMIFFFSLSLFGCAINCQRNEHCLCATMNNSRNFFFFRLQNCFLPRI